MHPDASLWDSGDDPVAALEQAMEVRRLALGQFGRESIPPGTPLSELELTLAPLYLHHRYQVEATAKLLGGMRFTYAVRGGDREAVEVVPPERQREALDALLATLEPAALAVPQRILELIPPPAHGYDDRREAFPSRSGRRFDPLAAAAVAAEVTTTALLEPTRAQRLIEFHARDQASPSFSEALDALAAKTPGGLRLAVRCGHSPDRLLGLLEPPHDPGRRRRGVSRSAGRRRGEARANGRRQITRAERAPGARARPRSPASRHAAPAARAASRQPNRFDGALKHSESTAAECYVEGSLDLEQHTRRLQDLGLNAYESRAYLVLIGHSHFKALEVAGRANIPRQKIYEVLDSLVDKGFVQVVQGKAKQFSAVEPRLALEGYLQRRKDSFEREWQERQRLAGLVGEDLEQIFDHGNREHGPLSYLRIVADTAQIAEEYRRLLHVSETEYLEFARPPYGSDPGREPALERALERGLRCRLLFMRKAVAPERLNVLADEGAQVRTIDDLPMKLALFDDLRGMISLDDPVVSHPQLTALVFEHESLASAMRSLFDDYWSRGEPL